MRTRTLVDNSIRGVSWDRACFTQYSIQIFAGRKALLSDTLTPRSSLLTYCTIVGATGIFKHCPIKNAVAHLAGPCRQTVIERIRLLKHAAIEYDRGQFPCIDGLVERRCTKKHYRHVCKIRCLPIADGLIEIRRVTKHPSHIGNRFCVPIADGLVKRICLEEHSVHVCDRGCIPIVNRLVERMRSIGHASHAGHRRCFPTAQRIVERFCVVKGCTHIRDLGGIPAPDVDVVGAIFLVAIIVITCQNQIRHMRIGGQQRTVGTRIAFAKKQVIWASGTIHKELTATLCVGWVRTTTYRARSVVLTTETVVEVNSHGVVTTSNVFSRRSDCFTSSCFTSTRLAPCTTRIFEGRKGLLMVDDDSRTLPWVVGGRSVVAVAVAPIAAIATATEGTAVSKAR